MGDTIGRSIRLANADQVDFSEAAKVIRLLRERFDPFGVRVAKQVVHGVTSLPASRATPAQVAGFVRGQWGIEKLVHWPPNVVFGEDEQGAYIGNGPPWRSSATWSSACSVWPGSPRSNA